MEEPQFLHRDLLGREVELRHNPVTLESDSQNKPRPWPQSRLGGQDCRPLAPPTYACRISGSGRGARIFCQFSHTPKFVTPTRLHQGSLGPLPPTQGSVPLVVKPLF